MRNTKSTYLVYDNQLEFKAFARRHGFKYEFYFDNIFCVDGESRKQPTIKYVKCDGSMTFGEALKELENYYFVTRILYRPVMIRHIKNQYRNRHK